VVGATVKVTLKMHLSLHPDGEPAPDPNAPINGRPDRSEHRRGNAPEPYVGATVSIEGTSVSKPTNAVGECKLPVAGLTGDLVVLIQPASSQDAKALVPAGSPNVRNQPSPAQLVAPTGVDFAYRGTRIAIRLENEKLKTQPHVISATDTHARVLKGAVETAFEVDIKADWLRDRNGTARPGPLQLVLVHHTGSLGMSGNLAEFSGGGKSIHYLMDLDGHIIKMVNDAQVANHAGDSRWAGQSNVSNQSIGIEICNDGGAYTAEQQSAITALVDQILTAQSLPRHHVVGHEDVGTTGTLLGRKGGDPGSTFPWQALEAANIGLKLSLPPPNDATMYNGVFATAQVMPTKSGPHVVELRQDLDAIGYSLNNTTSPAYDDHVVQAVFAFQRHFRTLERAQTPPGLPRQRDGIVDIRTAREIKRCQRF